MRSPTCGPRCGQWRLAHKYLGGTASTPLDPGTAESIVLDCAREYFYAAPSLQAPEVAQVPPRSCATALCLILGPALLQSLRTRYSVQWVPACAALVFRCYI